MITNEEEKENLFSSEFHESLRDNLSYYILLLMSRFYLISLLNGCGDWIIDFMWQALVDYIAVSR